jgi:N-formylmaleamate deformylase
LPTCDPEAIVQSYASFNDEDIHALMPEARTPALLIYAEHGGTVTDEDAAEICDLMPDCRAKRIDGAGHMIPWDDLDAFTATVEDFIAGGEVS